MFFPALDRDRDRDLDLTLAIDLDNALALTLDLDGAFVLALDRALVLSRVLNGSLSLDLSRNPELKQSLQQLKNQLPSQEENDKEQWWRVNGKAWTEQLRAAMIKHRNIGHDWQFSGSQKQLLQQYYDANKLLVNSLNSDCYISQEVRQEIEDTLLLPIAEIEKRKSHWKPGNKFPT
ncbi:NACHT C-terminal helical domain 2-containing protein [Coleofasciculus sp. E1-EBD-02]|uniref:NACHT C-terminal helical domain 2-containing protein n=1 Tax=Coleofasciculus sp. E1-EBD-02 TaxID=3068481 RepID=UPI0032F688F4